MADTYETPKRVFQIKDKYNDIELLYNGKDIETVVINGKSFKPTRNRGTIHAKLNAIFDKIDEVEKNCNSSRLDWGTISVRLQQIQGVIEKEKPARKDINAIMHMITTYGNKCEEVSRKQGILGELMNIMECDGSAAENFPDKVSQLNAIKIERDGIVCDIYNELLKL